MVNQDVHIVVREKCSILIHRDNSRLSQGLGDSAHHSFEKDMRLACHKRQLNGDSVATTESLLVLQVRG